MANYDTKIKPNEIVNLEIYQKDVIVRSTREGNGGGGGKKEQISELSEKSRKNLAFVANNTDVEFLYMVTLTYPSEYPGNGVTIKRELDAFFKRVKRQYGQFSYLWFLEFQGRGAPHFHILLTIEIGKEFCSRAWFEIVQSGDEKHLRAGTRVEKLRSSEGGKRYAVKYATKTRQKAVPQGFRDVGRFWGCSRDVKPIQQGVLLNTCKREVVEMLKKGEWAYSENVENLDYLPTTLFNASVPMAIAIIDRQNESD